MLLAREGLYLDREDIVGELKHELKGDHWEFMTSPEVEDTAYSVILLAGNMDCSIKQTSLDFISNQQLQNGSWYENVDATWICATALRLLSSERSSSRIKRALSYLERQSGFDKASFPVRCIVSREWYNTKPESPSELMALDLQHLLSLDRPTSPMIFYTSALAFALLMSRPKSELRHSCEILISRNISDNGSFQGLTRSTVYGGLASSLLDQKIAYLASCKFLLEEMYRPTKGFQTCKLPVWDTAWAVIALAHSREEIPSQVVKWIRSVHHDSGGYPFTSESRNVPPDLDTSSVVLLAFTTIGLEDEITERLISFLLKNQKPQGSWATWYYAKENAQTMRSLRELVAPNDEYSDSDIEVTAHAIMALSKVSSDTSGPTRKACSFLVQNQKVDGSWASSSIEYPEYVTSQCIIALVMAGLSSHSSVVRGIDFLVNRQKPDGSWGNDRERTALALWALEVFGKPIDSIRRARSFLLCNDSTVPCSAVPYGKTWGERNRIIDEGHQVYFPLIALSCQPMPQSDSQHSSFHGKKGPL